uniref:Telomeric single stranded DNA binding POT1/Cdc13 domain-containing protein n=1 Tax=Plectus sambesii TaxID=2011161 RepID=A0A914V429_9BILA
MSVYEYTKLADLSSSSSASKINCYGIVSSIEKEIKLFNPKTKQDQWQLIVQLVDESCSEKQSITCSLYADKQSTVPCVKRIGDILRLHRVPRTAEGFLGGRIGTCGFHAVVWDSEHGGSLNPRGATSANYSSNKDEQQR